MEMNIKTIIDKLFGNLLIDISDLRVYSSSENIDVALIEHIDIKLFNACVHQLRDAGFRQLQSSEADNFLSYTFADENIMLVLGFDSKAGELRIVADSESPMLDTVIKSEGLCPVRLWQYEIDHSLIDCGMCYIFQCSDYSFFIIDSAHIYSVNDDQRIYNFLRENTPAGMPVTVSGWFFSHGHVDHIGKFVDILRYNKDIIIKGLYFNFVPCDHFSSYAWMHSDILHTEEFYQEISKHKDIPVYKLHSGQYFCIDSLRIDVLCTHEDVYPHDLENYNDSSTVIMVTVGEDKICFPGDAGGRESEILERRFPSFLKSDIMQVAHHGHFGTSSDFYKLSGSKVALFATTQIKFDEELPHYEANRTVCEIAEHVFIASNGSVCFTFPLQSSDIEIYPDEIIENFDGVYNLWGYSYSDDFKNELIKMHKNNNKYRKIKY